MNLAPVRRLFLAAVAVLALAPGRPAWSELQVHVSRTQVGVYEPLRITVIDPEHREGAEAARQVAITMADGRDHHQRVHLSPTGEPGRWSGYFTPLSPGRYTGTAVSWYSHSTDIGLVPRIQVTASARHGFVTLHPTSKRVLRYASGPSLFPIGVSLSRAAVPAEGDWDRLVARLRAAGVNYVDVPMLLEADAFKSGLRAIDGLLAAAERNRRLNVQIRFVPPLGTEEGQEDARKRLIHCVRRWAYSPALAVWYLDTLEAGFSEDARTQWLRTVWEEDTYRHPVALSLERVRESAAESTGPLIVHPPPNLWVGTPGGEVTVNRPVILDFSPSNEEPDPEAFWQCLTNGRLGLPLLPWRSSEGDREHTLRLLRLASTIASRIPFHAGPKPLPDGALRGTTGTWTRYGTTHVGRISAARGHVTLPRLARGRYALRVWDLTGEKPPLYRVLWSNGSTPITTSTAFPDKACLLLEPAASTRKSSSRKRRSRPARRW